MLSYYEGYIILAFRDNVFQLNINKNCIDEKSHNDSNEPIVDDIKSE